MGDRPGRICTVGTGQMRHTLSRASEGGKPRARLGQSCKSILASHRLYVGKLLRGQAGKIEWSHTVDILSTMQRVMFNSTDREIC